MASSDLHAEKQALLGALSGPRRHVIVAVEGLDDEALLRPVLPSGWSCLGLINHLSHDVERFWFQAVVAGEAGVIDELRDSSTNASKVSPVLSANDVLEGYRRHIEQADSIITSTSLEAAPAWWPEDQFGSFRIHTVREIILHVLIETAAHAGHLDAARELIDGKQHLVLTD